MSTTRFPTDLPDTRWAVVGPLLLAGADHRRGPKLSDPRKRFVAVDVTGMPLARLACSARTSEVAGVEALLPRLADLDVVARLNKVRVDKGVMAGSAERLSQPHGIEVERYGWATHPQAVQAHRPRLTGRGRGRPQGRAPRRPRQRRRWPLHPDGADGCAHGRRGQHLKPAHIRHYAGRKPDTPCETGRQVIAFRAADELGLATPTPVRWSMWALPQ